MRARDLSSILVLAATLALPAPAAEQERAVPFWDRATTDAIHAAVDGRAALDTVRELSRFHRVHGSPGYAEAASYVRAKLAAAGVPASIERFPADGRTAYAHFVSYLGWRPESASLEEISPRPGPIASFPQLPVALADYSQDADVQTELVDAGLGTDPSSYEGKSVRGKLVLADGPLPLVHRLACEERGAAGFLSAFPNQTTAWSGEDPDQVRWGHLSPYQTANHFAFMVSKRQAASLRERLRAGETIRLRARVRARMVPATYDVVVGTILGSDPAAGEVVLTAHLCHQSAGANDNASGSAAILEVARSLHDAIRRRTLPPPKRTIRFLWLPEIAGSQAYLIRHPEVASRLVAGVHMDMVGGLLATTKGTFHLSRTAGSLPHVVNDVAQAFFDSVVRASARFAERGGDPRAGFAWPGASREAFLGDMRALEMGSDHQVFEESSFAVPMVYFHDWPDVTIHTNKDVPENLDATKLGRVAYLGAGIAWTLAALPDGEAPRLLRSARAAADARIAAARTGDGRDAVLAARAAVDDAIGTMESLARLWPVTAAAARREVERWNELAAILRPQAPAGADARVPLRSPQVRGPLSVYYYDHLARALGADSAPEAGLARRENGDLLGYEALNLVDGKRAVWQIRDALSGMYGAVPETEVREYLDLLARAKVIGWK